VPRQPDTTSWTVPPAARTARAIVSLATALFAIALIVGLGLTSPRPPSERTLGKEWGLLLPLSAPIANSCHVPRDYIPQPKSDPGAFICVLEHTQKNSGAILGSGYIRVVGENEINCDPPRSFGEGLECLRFFLSNAGLRGF
jgi:hypothetical protein